MKILVLATDYTVPGVKVASHFIHSRNLVYILNDIDVTVLSFQAVQNYEYEGVKVITLESYKENLNKIKYDRLLSHAPNLRNHYRFLKKYQSNFEKRIFFFHGHEVLIFSEVYPEPYKFSGKSSALFGLIQTVYDRTKVRVWKNYFNSNKGQSTLIFVSNWMRNQFEKFVEIDLEKEMFDYHIIYNCIGSKFQNSNFKPETQKKYDFITIRNILDLSKYSIDIVNNLATANPSLSFLVIGKGEFFNHYTKANNLTWIDSNLDHNQVENYLNISRVALLPTRADAQGVMACEIATFGIPLISSDIEVNREVLLGFENVRLIDNSDIKLDLSKFLTEVSNSKEKNKKYYTENTVVKEIKLIMRK